MDAGTPTDIGSSVRWPDDEFRYLEPIVDDWLLLQVQEERHGIAVSRLE